MTNYKNRFNHFNIMPYKRAKTKISFAFDIGGIALIVVAIILVKLGAHPLVEIIAGILATVGFGLIAGAKYV